MGRRPAPERSARPQGGADLRHLARRGRLRRNGTSVPLHLPATGGAISAKPLEWLPPFEFGFSRFEA